MQAPPLVGPDQPLLGGFVLRLPFPMARRVEDGSLVFWHTPKGLTFWIDSRRYDAAEEPVERWREERSSAATDECLERDGDLVRMGYQVDEPGGGREPSFYRFVASGGREFMIAAYFDAPEALDAAMATWRSVRAGPLPS